ncbi:MAG: sigma-70 family RNA polymerase sigma factor [Clostridiales bacterium]|jgi:RNA polymerase sigma-70 factor (ECF subfamily)|nr:sigma-70 family RNA polymerase sigma factor [Clostridiales bacterium]
MEQINKVFYEAKEGNKDAFAKLFDFYWKRAYYICFAKLGNRPDAEDAAQEVFLLLMKRINSIADPRFLSRHIQWLALEICGNHGKKGKGIHPSNIVPIDSLHEEPYVKEEEFLPEAFLEREDLKAQVLATIRELPEKQREVLLYYYYSGLSTELIGKHMKIQSSTVRTHLQLARATLKKKFQAKISKREMEMVGAVPVLSRILESDMNRICVPDIQSHIWNVLEKKIGLKGAKLSSGVNSSVAAKGTAGLGLKLAVSGMVVVAGLGAVFAGTNYAKMIQEPPDSPAYTDKVLSESANGILEALQKVKNRDDWDNFLLTWQFLSPGKAEEAEEMIYEVYCRDIEGDRVIAGSKESDGEFSIAWDVASIDTALPQDVASWVEDNIK